MSSSMMNGQFEMRAFITTAEPAIRIDSRQADQYEYGATIPCGTITAEEPTVSPWYLVEFADRVAQHGTQSIPVKMLTAWGLTGVNGTYTGRYACPEGTTQFLFLGSDSHESCYLSGACAKIVRAGEKEDIVRFDWQVWNPKEKHHRPHGHFNGSRIYIDHIGDWRRVRGQIIQEIESIFGSALVLRRTNP